MLDGEVVEGMLYESGPAAAFCTHNGHKIGPNGILAAVDRGDLVPLTMTVGGRLLFHEAGLRDYIAKMTIVKMWRHRNRADQIKLGSAND